MIRVALGGVAALVGLFLVWRWLLADAVRDAFAPPAALVRTLDLEELRRALPEPATLARAALQSLEEHVAEEPPFSESSTAGSEAVAPPGSEASDVAQEPSLASGEAIREDRGVEAALIRRMLDVYARTVGSE